MLVSCGILSGVWYVYFTSSQADNPICSDELKRCPDGSFIKLGGPTCSYPKCPAKPATPAAQVQSPAPDQSAAQIQSAPPDEVTRLFYAWYQGLKPEQLKSDQKRKQQFDSRQDLTANFKTQLDTAADNTDPLLCGTGKLNGFGIGSGFAGGNRDLVTVSLAGTLSSQNAEVELIDNNGPWQIDEVFCQNGPAVTRATGSPSVAVPDSPQPQDQPVDNNANIPPVQ